MGKKKEIEKAASSAPAKELKLRAVMKSFTVKKGKSKLDLANLVVGPGDAHDLTCMVEGQSVVNIVISPVQIEIK